MMYAKIFQQIFDSSLAEDYTSRHVFMDLLILADPEGRVDMTYEAIARRTNVPLETVRASICKLLQPDVNSRSTKDQGSRLVPLDEARSWGWQIVNFRDYRSMRNEVSRREYMRLYMQKRRAAEQARKQARKQGKPGKPQLADAEEESGFNNPPVAPPSQNPTQASTLAGWQDSDYETIGKTVRKDCRAELSNAKRKTGFQKYPPSWVLAALWQVNDRKKQGPVEIIKRAFGLLKRGSPKDSLLDRAKKELAKGRRKSPSGIGDLLKGAKP